MNKQLISAAIFSILLFAACKTNKDILIETNNAKIEYMGRVGKTPTATEIYWSGSSVKTIFKGTSISAILQDEKGDNYFNVIIDGEVTSILRPDQSKKTYLLAENLPFGKHSAELFKRTEWARGKTTFFGFKMKGSGKLLDIPKKEKTIEFYGNSITAGYAVEDYSGKDSPDSIFTNNYNSYAAMTARHFDANYSCIARSGIGITISWFPQIMPELYNRHDPSDPKSIWDFNKTKPDVVVINLLQNDSWLVAMPGNEQFKNRFGTSPPDSNFIINAYRNFVQSIRKKCNAADIICMLGNMDITKEGSPWPGYVAEAVRSLEDDKIHTLFVPYKNTPGHPHVEEQRVLADSLIRYIERNIFR